MGFTDKLQFQDFTTMITYFVTNQPTQVALTCLKPTMETPEQCVKFVQIWCLYY